MPAATPQLVAIPKHPGMTELSASVLLGRVRGFLATRTTIIPTIDAKGRLTGVSKTIVEDAGALSDPGVPETLSVERKARRDNRRQGRDSESCESFHSFSSSTGNLKAGECSMDATRSAGAGSLGDSWEHIDKSSAHTFPKHLRRTSPEAPSNVQAQNIVWSTATPELSFTDEITQAITSIKGHHNQDAVENLIPVQSVRSFSISRSTSTPSSDGGGSARRSPPEKGRIVEAKKGRSKSGRAGRGKSRRMKSRALERITPATRSEDLGKEAAGSARLSLDTVDERPTPPKKSNGKLKFWLREFQC